MEPLDHLLQERLALLEIGETLETCLDDLSEEEALLIKKAVQLRSDLKCGLTAERAAAQRKMLIQFAKEQKMAESRTSLQKRQSTWVWPFALAGSGIVILAFVTIFAILAGLAVLRWRNASQKIAQNLPLETTIPGSGLKSLTPAPEKSYETAIPGSGSDSINPTPEISQAVTEPPDALSALLGETRGLVEVQGMNGAWEAAHNGTIMKAGQSLRTGALSSASLVFYDGSRVKLGPLAEIQLDTLDAPRSGPRLIRLSQKIGESDHQVVPSSDPGSTYEVTTPYGYGVARGTGFHVTVLQTKLVRFDVDEGVVDVTKQEVTVQIAAGQSTIIIPSGPPSDPLYRITGQGKVEQTGNWWRIAGDTFMVNGHTQVIGNPQVGDWVAFESVIYPDDTRLLTRVVLLRRAPENRFTFSGTVEAIGAAQWTVAGRVIQTDHLTVIDPGIQVGNQVEVNGRIEADGTLWTEQIRLIVKAPGLPFAFTGVVQSISESSWLISGITVTVNVTTTIDTGIVIGDVVAVQGWTLADGTWLAKKIQLAVQDVPDFEIVGVVQSLSPWKVSGIEFTTDENTRFGRMFQMGDRVRVKGIILNDGSWLAQDIQLLEIEEEQDFNFVGFVISQAPWIVDNIALTVDANTEIIGNISVGDQVWVKGVILPDGAWLARKIQRLEHNLGCLTQTMIVIRVDENEIVVRDQHRDKIKKHNDLHIIGEVKVATVVIITGCVQEDGSFVVTQIVVIHQFDKVPDIHLPEDKRKDDDDDDDDDDHDD